MYRDSYGLNRTCFTNRWRLEQAEAAYVEFNKQAAGKSVIEF